MLITPTTKTVTTYILEIDEADVAECLSAPYEFSDHIGALLRAAGAGPATNGNGHHKPGKDHPLSFKAQTARKTRAAKAARPNGKAGIKCPQCGKTLMSQGMLDRHLRQKHGQASTASAAESASTN